MTARRAWPSKLLQKLGMNFQFALADGGSTLSGIAILSRFPLSDTTIHNVTRVNLMFRLGSESCLQ